MPVLDKLDAELIAVLCDDARMSIMELAGRLGVARNTVQARLAKIAAAGLQPGLGPDADLSGIGMQVGAYVRVQLVQPRLHEFLTAVTEIPQVLEAHMVAGEHDLMVRIAAADQADLQCVVECIVALPGVVRTSTTIVLTTPVRFRALPLLRHATRDAGRGRADRREKPCSPPDTAHPGHLAWTAASRAEHGAQPG